MTGIRKKTDIRFNRVRKRVAKLQAAFLILVASILFKASCWYTGIYHRNSVDKHGVPVRAIIFNKTLEFRGKTIYFSYSYNGTEYKDHAHNDHLYNSLNYGQTFLLQIDSLDPEENYLLKGQ